MTYFSALNRWCNTSKKMDNLRFFCSIASISSRQSSCVLLCQLLISMKFCVPLRSGRLRTISRSESLVSQQWRQLPGTPAAYRMYEVPTLGSWSEMRASSQHTGGKIARIECLRWTQQLTVSGNGFSKDYCLLRRGRVTQVTSRLNSMCKRCWLLFDFICEESAPHELA